MRLNYQPPLTQLYSTKYRRRLALLLLLIGLILVISFLTTKSTSELNYKDDSVASSRSNRSSQSNKANLAAKTPILEVPITKNIETTKTVVIKPGDTLSKVFSRVGVSSNILHNILAIAPIKQQLSKIHPKQRLEFTFDDNDNFKELKLNMSPTKTLHIRNTNTGYKYYYEKKQLARKIKYSSNKINDSLFSSAQSSGLDDKLTMQLASIFGWDIDFVLDIRPDDSFKVLYEEEFIDGKKVDTGKILIAEFTNQGKSYKAIHYTDKDGRTGYYAPDGFSMQKAFIRTPVKFTRISSYFSTNKRKHPILHKIRDHKGVDYVAPLGTPVKSAGNGKVIFVGKRGGYGNVIEISHGNKYSTLYAHLSKFAKNIKEGSLIKQGQVIGYVGKTGLATGAHLHYEFRINGVRRNPLTVKFPRSQPISDEQKPEFLTHADKMIKLLDAHHQNTIVNNHERY